GPSRAGGDCAQEPRDYAARARRRARRRGAGPVPGHARAAARAADRRRPPRHGLLLRARAREGQGDARDVRRGGVRDAPPGLPVAAALRGGPHLSRRRPRRPGRADLAAARRRPAGVRRDGRDPRRGPRRGLGAHHVTAAESSVAVTRQPAEAPSRPVDIRLEHVTKRFDDVVAVVDLSPEIEQGSFFALLGPSVCGEATTLRMIGGFEEPYEGTILLGDRDVTGLPPY